MEQYELYRHSNAVEANCTEIEEQYSSGSRFCRRKQDFLCFKNIKYMTSPETGRELSAAVKFEFSKKMKMK